jgi:hypothetical protein
LPQPADPNVSSNVALESGGTGFVECLVRLQAEAAADDFLLDLGGAAEDQPDTVKPPELTTTSKSMGLVLNSHASRAGLHLISVSRGVRVVRSGRRSPARGSSRRAAVPKAAAWPDDYAEPAAADVPAFEADIDSGKFITAELPQILMMHDASNGHHVGSCSRESPRRDQYFGRGENAHHDSMSTCGAR